MDDLDACLARCDRTLAQAQTMLIAMRATGMSDADLAPVQRAIDRLRREVMRLRGLEVARVAGEKDPLRIEFHGGESPWPQFWS